MSDPKPDVLFAAEVMTDKGMGRLLAEQHEHRGANEAGSNPITIAIAFGDDVKTATLTRNAAVHFALEILGANRDELASFADRLPDQIVEILAPAAERALARRLQRGGGGSGTPPTGGMPEAS